MSDVVWGVTRDPFDLTYHFPDLYHIHGNSVDTMYIIASVFDCYINILQNQFLMFYSLSLLHIMINFDP